MPFCDDFFLWNIKSFRNAFGFCYFKVKPKEEQRCFQKKKKFSTKYATVTEL